MFIQKNKNITILFIIITIIIISFCFLFLQKKPVNKSENNLLNKTERNYSRISIFNSYSTKISLAIPEDWEGNYRIKELGDTVIFYNIEKPEQIFEMFKIKIISIIDGLKDNYINNGWQKIQENDKYIILYTLSTKKEDTHQDNIKLTSMLNDIEEIIMSAKLK